MNTKRLLSNFKLLLIFTFMGASFATFALEHSQNKSYLDHLSEVNKEWLKHQEFSPSGTISFASDVDRIQLHLNLVIKYLQLNPSAALNAKQLSNRQILLEKLQQYADNKVFPINKYHAVRQPYFVDEIGTNCAVGQLIYDSGFKDLVAKISKEHNYDYIADIHTAGLQEWAKEFGFTIDELKWIQPGYVPNTTIDQVLGATNGEVVKIANNNSDGSLVIAGKFTELDSLPCLNIGTYKNNQLACLGSGVDGIIKDVLATSGKIYAFGELNHNNQIYPVAVFENSVWSYLEIPTRENAMATAANVGGSSWQFELAISHASISGYQEIWHYKTNNTWVKKAMVKGVILDIIPSSYGRVHVGQFDSVTVYDAATAIDTTLIVNNVLIYANYSSNWYGITGNVSNKINVVAEIGGALIFGGTCTNQPGDDICISRYFNSIIQPIYMHAIDPQTWGYSVNTIAMGVGSSFVFGGDFRPGQYSMSLGRNLANYNLVTNDINFLARFNNKVNSLAFLDGKLYIGGEFQSNNFGQNNVQYLARVESSLGVKETDASGNLNAFPNPFNSTLNLKGIEDGAAYTILFIDGRIAKKGSVLNEKIEQLDFLPKGTYLLQLETEKGTFVKQVFK
ncbi:MAG: T9SS type A sorting domain-containing protein [Crocinitomicaceae bacterium]|nr:T9SS type A sorting domain-containing protein [Crocinitomicaceae bacterium]